MGIECKNLTNGLRISTDGKYFSCCHLFNNPFKDENGNLLLASTHTIEQAMKAHSRLEMVDEFSKGIRSKGCKVCWDAEDAGFESKRIRDNETYRAFPERRGSDIFFLELNLGNTCNLACRICHISASSKWRAHHHVLEPNITEEDLDKEMKKYSKPFEDDSIVWNELMNLLPQIQSLDVYGGEPMLMKKQWEILEESVKRGYAATQSMSFNTNGTILTEKYIDILSAFKFCRVGLSLDGTGDKFKYLRYPGNWKTVDTNIKTWLERTKHIKDKIKFVVSYTVSILNVLYIFDMVDYVVETGLTLHMGFVHNPGHLAIDNLPLHIKPKIVEILENKLNKRLDAIKTNHNLDKDEQERIQTVYKEASNVIAALKLNKKPSEYHWNEFKRQTGELDILRQQSFEETFPEANKLYELQLNKKSI